MRILLALAYTLALFLPIPEAMGETIKKAYLDRQKNVHVITTAGKDRKLTSKGNVGSLKIAADNRTIGWLVLNTWTAEGDDGPGSEELTIYRDGNLSSVKCGPFIRDYWFWEHGAQVVIDCGGRHFAGREILYDTQTLKEVASLDQAKIPLEKRPNWALGSDFQETDKTTIRPETADLKLKMGEPFLAARKRILKLGWKPDRMHMHDKYEYMGTEVELSKLGFVEVDSCSVDAGSLCIFYYRKGNECLRLDTVGEQAKQMTVRLWSNECFIERP